MTEGTTLITGGTGFIGSRLALALREQGTSVRVLALENTEAEAKNRRLLDERGVELVLGSVTELREVERATEGVAIVYHLAAAQHEMNVSDGRFREVNVHGTANVIKAADISGVRRVIYGSTIGVYGDPDRTVDESSPTRPVNIYGETKLEAEGVVLAAQDRLHVTVVRIPEVYGPGDRRLLKLFRMLAGGGFALIGSGRNLHHPMYVDDLIRGLITIAEGSQPSGETFLLSGPEPVDTRGMISAVSEAVGKKPPRSRLPLWPFLAAAVLMEGLLRPLGIQPPLHRRRLDFFRKSFSLSSERVRRVLGFEPRVGFREGAQRTAEWYALEGLLDARPKTDRG